MSFDFKKQYKSLYNPTEAPMLIDVGQMNFIMVDGTGDPNGNPVYQEALEILYGLSYTIKMSYKSNWQIDGYFDYVVAPPEGLWTISDGKFEFDKRDNWVWTMMIRQPDFVTKEVFDAALAKALKKKPDVNYKKAYYKQFSEGLCVQALHVGPYITEEKTTNKMEQFMNSNNLVNDMYQGIRHHHEIYLSDPRKTAPEKLKTILRIPVVRK